MNPSMVKAQDGSLLVEFAGYWQTPLGDFYGRWVNRYLLYVMMTLMAGGFTFLALEAYALVRPGRDLPLAFQGMYAWETALNFGLCHYILDEWLSRCWGRWWKFENRSIGKVWLIWWCAYLLAFAIQRTLIYATIPIYYPRLIDIFTSMPGTRPTHMQSLMFCFPFWCVIAFALIEIARRPQPKKDEKQRHSDLAALAQEKGQRALLRLPTPRGIETIDVERISHISVEDHYCRFFVASPEGIQEKLFKIALKRVIDQLPKKSFVQVHRSHVVNLSHANHLEKKGRCHTVTLKTTGRTLPVSRHRLPQLPETLLQSARIRR